MAYSLYDYTETLNITGIEPQTVLRCVAAWGEEGDYAEWHGGFLLELRDKRFAYITGWCDTTGWGCQDGADVTYYDCEPERASLNDDWTGDWDEEPADLNLWHAQGGKDP